MVKEYDFFDVKQILHFTYNKYIKINIRFRKKNEKTKKLLIIKLFELTLTLLFLKHIRKIKIILLHVYLDFTN